MKNSIRFYVGLLVFFGGIFFYQKMTFAQKSKYEAYIGTEFNLDAYNKLNIKSSCNSGELSIVPFNQADEIWADEIMVDPLTIQSHGCAMTCMAMLLHAHGQDVTPQILNSYLKENSGYTSSGEILWNIAGDFGSSTVGNLQFSNFDYQVIRTQIEDSNPVIIQVKMDDPDDSHFVIITGYEDGGDEPKDFYIIDPSGGTQRRMSVYENDCQSGYNNLRIFTAVNAPCINIGLPDHCYNCIWESQYGEIETDCGGECPPCFKSDYLCNILNSTEIDDEIVATGYVNIESENNQMLVLSGVSSIKAGNEIVLKNNVTIPSGSSVILKTTNNSNELTRDCDEPCIYVPNAYNLSYHQYLTVNLTNIEHVYYILFDRDKQIVNEFNGSISYDGTISLFELPSTTATYFSISEYVACTGEVYYVNSSVTILDGREKSESAFSHFKPDSLYSLNNRVIQIYPNPTTGFVNVVLNFQSNENIGIEVQQMNGNIIHTQIYQHAENIILNLSPYPPGIYLLLIKTPEKVYTEKIVLQ